MPNRRYVGALLAERGLVGRLPVVPVCRGSRVYLRCVHGACLGGDRRSTVSIHITLSILGWGFRVEEDGHQHYESNLHYGTQEEAIAAAGKWMVWYGNRRAAA
jgi:hypothetical protein